MYFDNLTMAGIVAVSLYAFLPLLFGRETLRVAEAAESVTAPRDAAREAKRMVQAGRGNGGAGSLNPAPPGG
jgi:hypothetical protein